MRLEIFNHQFCDVLTCEGTRRTYDENEMLEKVFDSIMIKINSSSMRVDGQLGASLQHQVLLL